MYYSCRSQRLENGILSYCSNPTAKITEDRDVIAGVESLKEAAKVVSEAAAATAAAKLRIDAAFDNYRPVAARAALLLELAGALLRLHPTYRLPYAAFLQCVQRALRATDPNEVPAPPYAPMRCRPNPNPAKAEPFEEEEQEQQEEEEEEEEGGVVDDTIDIGSKHHTPKKHLFACLFV